MFTLHLLYLHFCVQLISYFAVYLLRVILREYLRVMLSLDFRFCLRMCFLNFFLLFLGYLVLMVKFFGQNQIFICFSDLFDFAVATYLLCVGSDQLLYEPYRSTIEYLYAVFFSSVMCLKQLILAPEECHCDD